MGPSQDAGRNIGRPAVSWAAIAVVVVVGTVVVIVAAAAALGGFGALGGLDGGADEAPATGTPAGDERVATPPSCSGPGERPGFDLPAGTVPSAGGGFELAASADAVALGERISFSLANVAEERRYTGTRPKYALQRRVAGEWETVTRFREPSLGFNATAVAHDPGEGFEWSFRASADGFSGGKYVVCERLDPGDYRFVYASEPVLAVEFEIVEK